MKASGRPWMRDELILAINLYCKIPFGKIHIRNPEIITLAKLLGRSPGSISYKLANFASIDPSLPRKGAANVSRLDRDVWNEFFENWNGMSYESEHILCEIRGQQIDSEVDLEIPKGTTRESLVKARVNQNFFRSVVLASYDNACCVTGLPVTELLVASHIIPWSKDENNRTNPRNGLCLNSLHDRAFDIGFVTIDEDYKVKLSSRIKTVNAKALVAYEGVSIRLPKRFLPQQEFLAFHRQNIFKP